MNPVKARTLKPHEGLTLHRMKRQFVNQVNSRHARIVLLSRGGTSNARIAEHCDCTPTWVRQILHRFNAGGIEAIAWYPTYCSTAGPREFVAEVLEQIGEVALSPPKKRIGMAVGSLQKLREYLQTQKIVGSDLPGMAAATAAAKEDPLAAHPDLEGLHRSAVLAPIQANPATLSPAARGGADACASMSSAR